MLMQTVLCTVISRFRARLFSAHALALVLAACSTMSPLLARTLNVGVSGNPPFVQKTETSFNGISLEVWEAIAAENNYNYKLIGQHQIKEFKRSRWQH